MAVDFETVIFVIVSGAAVIGALGCVFSARVAHSLLWLMFTLNALSAVSGIGVFAFILALLRGVMEHSMWDSEAASPPSTLEFADSIFNDWTMATIILGALLAMAMIGASYLVRDERLINLLWDMGAEE